MKKEITQVTPVIVRDSEDSSPDKDFVLRMEQKAVQNGVATVVTGVDVKNSKTPTPSPETPAPAAAISPETIKALIAETIEPLKASVEASAKAAATAEINAIKAEYEAKQAESDRLVAETNEKLSAATQVIATLQVEKNTLETTVKNYGDLGKLHGSQSPVSQKDVTEQNNNVAKFTTAFNTNIKIGYNDKLPGAFREIQHHIDSLPKVEKVVFKEGNSQRVLDFDKQELDRYVRQNYKQVIADLNTYGKGAGLFRGSNTRIIQPGEDVQNTVIADLPGGFLPTLSAIMRVTHRPGFVFHQLPLVRYDFAARKGTTIKIGRFNYLSTSPNLSDYILSGGGTYSPITSRSDAMSTSTVDVNVLEYGRGKDDAQTQINPIRIVDFVEYFSAYELINELNMKFGFDYAQFEDRLIRSRFDLTSVVWYNRGNTLSTSATALQNGDGRMNKQLLREMRHTAHSNRWETIPDGNFISIMNPTAWKQLREDLDDDWEAPTPQNLMDFLNAMLPAYVPDLSESRVDGYRGLIEGVHCFESNAFGVGNAGSDGVTSVTVRAGSPPTTATFRESYFMGHGAVGRGVSMPVEVRIDNVTNFDREQRLTWVSWEGVDAIDVDPTGTGNASQQLRVAKFRTTDNALSGLS